MTTPLEEQQAEINSHFQQDASLGLIRVQVLDCLFQPAAEVTVTVSTSGTATQVCPGTGMGFACADAGPGVSFGGAEIINVPMGDVQVTAWALGVPIPIGTYTVHVRAGSEVQLIALPRPP